LLSLQELQSFSIANNKICDIGIQGISSTLLTLKKLKIIDLFGCFITAESLHVIKTFVTCSTPKIEILMLQNNLFQSEQLIIIENYKSYSPGIDILIGNDPYNGISLPLRYDLKRDFVQEFKLINNQFDDNSSSNSFIPKSDNNIKTSKKIMDKVT
jgi:hypothetical protein